MDRPPGRKRTTKPGSAANAASEPAQAAAKDRVLIHGVSEDGEKLAVLRARDDHVEAGVISRVKEGEPLHGELLKLTPHADFPLLCDVQVELPSSASRIGVKTDDRIASPRLSHGGPAQVASESYRANWDAIWSAKKRSNQQLN